VEEIKELVRPWFTNGKQTLNFLRHHLDYCNYIITGQAAQQLTTDESTTNLT